MPNFDSSLRECFGFSQIIISELFRVFIARALMSLRLPIGVDTIEDYLEIKKIMEYKS